MRKVPRLRGLATGLLLVSLLALAVSAAVAPAAQAAETYPCAFTGSVTVDGADVPAGTPVRVMQDSTELGQTTTGFWPTLADNEYYLDITGEAGDVALEVQWDCGGGNEWLPGGTATLVQYGKVTVDLYGNCEDCVLTTSADPVEGGTTTGDGTYECGTDAAITATPADACWYFVNWTGDPDIEDPDSASTTVHIDGTTSVTANFAKYSYSLTTSASPSEGGTTTGDGTYECCTDAAINADPGTGYEFVNWTGDADIADPDSASTTVHIDGTTSVTANFELEGGVVLCEGWNLLSTPVTLESDGNADTFGQIVPPAAVNGTAYRFYANHWYPVTSYYHLDPLEAIYVNILSGGTKAIMVEEDDITSPPTRNLYTGWNMVGPAPGYDSGFPDTPVMENLACLITGDIHDELSFSNVVSPPLCQEGWTFNPWFHDIEPDMEAYKGYWVYMEETDVLVGYSTTPLP